VIAAGMQRMLTIADAQRIELSTPNRNVLSSAI
jgi:hypothetical protein